MSWKPIARIRNIVQLGGMVLLGEWLFVGTLRCPYGVPFMSCGSCPVKSCPGTWLQTWVIGLLVISGLVIGRVFCGWVCPMGVIQDVLGRLPKLRAVKRPRFGRIDRWLKGLKYVMLAVTLLAFYTVNERFSIPVRTASTWDFEGVRVAWLTYDAVSRTRVVIILAGIVLGLVVTRAWCRYLCPLGAVLTIGNRIGLLRLRKNPAVCTGCGRYPRECRTYTTPGTADCVVCGDCVEGCPRHGVVLSSQVSHKDEKRLVSPEASPTPSIDGKVAADTQMSVDGIDTTGK